MLNGPAGEGGGGFRAKVNCFLAWRTGIAEREHKLESALTTCWNTDSHFSKHSRYFTPEPVLKITTRSSGAIFLPATSVPSAAKQAAPSGATKSPSLAPISRLDRNISSSSIVIAPPPE